MPRFNQWLRNLSFVSVIVTVGCALHDHINTNTIENTKKALVDLDALKAEIKNKIYQNNQVNFEEFKKFNNDQKITLKKNMSEISEKVNHSYDNLQELREFIQNLINEIELDENKGNTFRNLMLKVNNEVKDLKDLVENDEKSLKIQ